MIFVSYFVLSIASGSGSVNNPAMALTITTYAFALMEGGKMKIPPSYFPPSFSLLSSGYYVHCIWVYMLAPFIAAIFATILVT